MIIYRAVIVVLSLIVWSLTHGRINSQTECNKENSLRLRNGQDQFEGRVEICTRTSLRSRRLGWRAVCDNGWDIHEARVTCRQLGFEINGLDAVVATHNNYFGKDKRNVNNVRWQCFGNESSLTNCKRINFCTSRQSAGVYCKGINLDRNNCHEGEVRLVNGRSSLEGRVEICKGGLWGSVCHDQWGVNDAKAVCRQLGQDDPRPAFPQVRAFFGEGNGPIHLKNVQCSSSNNRLADCQSSFNTQDCGHYQDAGVTCSGHDGCNEGELRLVDGRDEMEGRVEVCFRGVWGTVCNDKWNNNSATVVCQQLGLGDIGVATTAAAQFGEGEGPILLDDVRCSGGESHIVECKHRSIGVHNCDHQQDAGVFCYSTTNKVPLSTTRATSTSTEISTTFPPSLNSPPSNSQTKVIATSVVIVLVTLALLVAVTVVVVFLLSRRRKTEHQENRSSSDPVYESNNYAELVPNQTVSIPAAHQHTNPLHNSPVYSVIKNGNPLPYNHKKQETYNGTSHLEAVTGDYEEPIDSLNAHKNHTDEDYSTLDPPVENDYATLEPFIPGAKRDSKSSRDSDNYSFLQHQ